jgi:uncharacterized RDD family membrane protein YckC
MDDVLTRSEGQTDAPVTVHVAGFWRRAAQGIVDGAIVLPVAFLLSWIAGKLSGLVLPAARSPGIDYWLDLALAGEPALWGGLLLGAAIVTMYLLIFQAMAGQTPGMRLLKLRVVDVYGGPPGPLRATARAAGYLLCFVTLGLGFIWIGFDREKRGLHDWLAGTYVILGDPR